VGDGVGAGVGERVGACVATGTSGSLHTVAPVSLAVGHSRHRVCPVNG
jgi:hypothetical protein